MERHEAEIERLQVELDDCKQRLAEETDLRAATQRELESKVRELEIVEAANEAMRQ